MKTLIFEGAGWEKAEGTNDVTNCRIRTRMAYYDKKIYFEAIQGADGKGYVNHCFKDHCNEISAFRDLEGKSFVWTNYGIIKFINTIFPGNESFQMIKVVNDGSLEVHATKECFC